MTMFELTQELMKIGDADIPVAGKVEGFILPVYGIYSKRDFLLFNLLHEEPWPNAERKTKKMLESLSGCSVNEELFPNAERTRIYLELNEYNFDYSTTVKYYEADGFDCKDGRFIVVAKAEMIEMREKCSVDPYLLKMQKEHPMDSFYFPFRPGVDKK